MKSEPKVVQTKQHSFPVELVATVAAALISRRTDGPLAPAAFLIAADEAVKLLQACKTRLENDEFFTNLDGGRAARKSLDEAKASARTIEMEKLQKKYPNGVPWRKGLLLITGKKREADALPPFREWRLHERKERRLTSARQQFGVDRIIDDSPDRFDKDKVKKLDTLKTSNFIPADIFNYRRAFRTWYEEVGIPARRKKAGLSKKKPAKRGEK